MDFSIDSKDNMCLTQTTSIIVLRTENTGNQCKGHSVHSLGNKKKMIESKYSELSDKGI